MNMIMNSSCNTDEYDLPDEHNIIDECQTTDEDHGLHDDILQLNAIFDHVVKALKSPHDSCKLDNFQCYTMSP